MHRTTRFVLLLTLLGCSPPSSDDTVSDEETSMASPAPVNEGHFPGADGVRLFHRILGEGEPTVIVIHGGPGNDMEYLVPDLEPLTRRFRLVFYDQRGGGRSELPEDPAALDIGEHVRDLEALRVHLGLERVVLLAHSFGPALAALYAMEHPERVEKMVFLGPIPPWRGDFFERFAAATSERLTPEEEQRLGELAAAISEGDDPTAACREFWSIALKPRLADPTRLDVVKGDLCAAPPEALRYGMGTTNPTTFGSLGDWDFREGLARVSAPTLIVHGEEEAIPMDMVEAWATSLPNARLLRVPEAAHFPYVERPDIVWPEIEAFLGE